tara:strand:- start:9250 stop:10467 length:1218 start_codon:yes stop_codon:yes gene_type:complete
MKILYLSNHRYDFSLKSTYNNGGWIESLTESISKIKDFDVNIAYFAKRNSPAMKIDGIKFYPVDFNNKLFIDRVKRYFELDKPLRKKQTLALIDKIKPDIIHIFGMECFACDFIEEIKSKSDVILHIQGFLMPIYNSFFPPYSLYSFKNFFRAYKKLKSRAFNSLKTIKNIKYYSGRTEWDRNLIDFYSKNYAYFNINEILRSEFYESDKWTIKDNNIIIITSTISDVIYKGLDIIFKTSKLLIKKKINFRWNIIGLNYNSFTIKFYEKNFRTKCNDLNIYPLGICNTKEIINNLLKSNLYVHPSYIENSCNSLCEALMLGLPTISNNVGGISSFINNMENGELIPSNDPSLLAARIITICNDKKIQQTYSRNARKSSLNRHNKKSIILSTVKMYNEINSKKYEK